MSISNKKVIIFDLDGTLAESKSEVDAEMSGLLAKLLASHKVAVMSGGAFAQFEKQFLSQLPKEEVLLNNLSLFPTSGTSYYKFENGSWQNVYSQTLSESDKKEITEALKQVEVATGISEIKTYGEKIEDRGTQITYSGLGQDAPLELKKNWDPDQIKRSQMVKILTTLLPEFEARMGGATSIDITHKGIDKAYGVRKVEEALNTPIDEMLFVGDAIFPGGNDYPATTTGIDYIRVMNVEDTKKLIRSIAGENN